MIIILLSIYLNGEGTIIDMKKQTKDNCDRKFKLETIIIYSCMNLIYTQLKYYDSKITSIGTVTPEFDKRKYLAKSIYTIIDLICIFILQ